MAADKVIYCDKKVAKGFICTLPRFHAGPCLLQPKQHWWDALGEAIGEAMFGGGR